jgi:hypothetical protein
VDKVALGQVSSEFRLPVLIPHLLHTHHHHSSGAGTIGQLVADVASGLSLTPHLTKPEKVVHCNFDNSTQLKHWGVQTSESFGLLDFQ